LTVQLFHLQMSEQILKELVPSITFKVRDSVRDCVKDAVKEAVKTQLSTAFRESFEGALLPAFQARAQVMFQQVQQAFAQGMQGMVKEGLRVQQVSAASNEKLEQEVIHARKYIYCV